MLVLALPWRASVAMLAMRSADLVPKGVVGGHCTGSAHLALGQYARRIEGLNVALDVVM